MFRARPTSVARSEPKAPMSQCLALAKLVAKWLRVTAAVAIVASGCGGSETQSPLKKRPPLDAEARLVADTFVQRLLAGDPKEAARYLSAGSSPLAAELPKISREMRTYAYIPAGRSQRADDGFVYEFLGRSYEPKPTGVYIHHARWKVIVEAESEKWSVSGFETVSGTMGPPDLMRDICRRLKHPEACRVRSRKSRR